MNWPDDFLADIAAFITAFGLAEAIELTEPDDASAVVQNDPVLQLALDDALQLVCSYEAKAPCLAGKIAIRKRTRRMMLNIARYYLDNDKTRESVVKMYDDEISFLEGCLDKALCSQSVSQDDLDDVGLDQLCPGVRWCAQERVWTRETTSDYRDLPYFRGRRVQGRRFRRG